MLIGLSNKKRAAKPKKRRKHVQQGKRLREWPASPALRQVVQTREMLLAWPVAAGCACVYCVSNTASHPDLEHYFATGRRE